MEMHTDADLGLPDGAVVAIDAAAWSEGRSFYNHSDWLAFKQPLDYSQLFRHGGVVHPGALYVGPGKTAQQFSEQRND